MTYRVIRLSIVALSTLLVSVTMDAQPTAKNSTLALTNATIIDGTGGPPKPNQTLIISGERISDLFTTGKKRLPRGATVIDLANYYIIPGLIDSHYHLMPNLFEPQEGIARRRFAFLGGVTTVRDMAGDAIALRELSVEARKAAVECPRIYYSALMAGPSWFTDPRAQQISHGLSPGEAPWARAITAETDIKKVITQAKATGAIAIKIYADLDAPLVTKLTAEAHRQGLKVWSHSTVFPAKPSDAVNAGVDAISHSDGLAFEAVAQMPKQYAGTYRSFDWNSVSPDAPAITTLLKRMNRRGTVLDATLYLTVDDPNSAQTPRAQFTYDVTRRAHQFGVVIVAGTDLPERPRRREFPNLHIEIELLVTKAGMTPLQAITAATVNTARLMGIDKDYGTVAKGKIADLVVLSADPSKDIRNTRRIMYVIKGGTVHKWEKVVMPY